MDPFKNLNTWLEDMTYASEYTFLEEGKDDDELARIAKKRGISLPSHDLAIFKCKYAFTDRVNKNGCLLPREEVAKSLSTLVGKAVDFDHFRKRICGTWIDADLVGDQIVAYGSFFKSNLQDDFTTIKDLMQRGALSVSFEAWGNKKTLKGNSYSLNDITFAGGALLLKESPAFPGADVMEMANNRVLEFAKVMTKPEEFLHTGDSTVKKEETLEIKTEDMPECARHWVHDNMELMKNLGGVDCSVCHNVGNHDLQKMDYANSEGLIKCTNCGTTHKVFFTPTTEVVKKGKPRQITEIKSAANLEIHEDINAFIENYEGSDENLEMVLANEFEQELEEAKFIKCMQCANVFDLHGNTTKCPKCGAKWVKATTPELRPEERTDSPYSVVNKLNPDPQLSKVLDTKSRNDISDEKFAVVVTTKNKKTGKPRKIRMFPINNPAHVRNALARLPQAAESLKRLGISQETVKNKILKRARELKMDELLKLHKASTVEELIQAMAKAAGAKDGLGAEAIADVKTKIEQALTVDTKEQSDLATKVNAYIMPHVTPLIKYEQKEKDANATSLNTEKLEDPKGPKAEDPSLNTKPQYPADYEKVLQDLKEVTNKMEEATAKLKKYEEAEKAAEKAKIDELVKARKEELGEFAKDMKDEDLLDVTKYEMAKLRKENAELKAGKETPKNKPDLTKGSADKEINKDELKTRGKVDELAFGRDGKATKETIKKIK